MDCVAGILPGISSLSLTGCYVTQEITVNPLPAFISGALTVCEGATITLSCLPSGGTWSSSTPTVATVGSSSSIVTGVLAGTATISYTLSDRTKQFAKLYTLILIGSFITIFIFTLNAFAKGIFMQVDISKYQEIYERPFLIWDGVPPWNAIIKFRIAFSLYGILFAIWKNLIFQKSIISINENHSKK